MNLNLEALIVRISINSQYQLQIIIARIQDGNSMITPFKSPSKTGTELEASSLLAGFMMPDNIKQGMGKGKEFMD